MGTRVDVRNALVDVARQRPSAFGVVTVPNNIHMQVANAATRAQVAGVNARVAVVEKVVVPPPTTSTHHTTTVIKRDVKIGGKGYEAKGLYYQVSLEFALGINFNAGDIYTPDNVKNVPSPAIPPEERLTWGTGWSNPLVNPRNWCRYHVKVEILQPTRGLLIGGFELLWGCPPNWKYIDGEPLKMLVEVTSNPLIIMRKVMSPKTGKIPNSVFTCAVLKTYP